MGLQQPLSLSAAGGTGEIWRSVAGLLPQEKLRFGARIASIDLDRKSARLDDGSRFAYDHLITSIPRGGVFLKTAAS